MHLSMECQELYEAYWERLLNEADRKA
jgi:hypothetical protein